MNTMQLDPQEKTTCVTHRAILGINTGNYAYIRGSLMRDMVAGKPVTNLGVNHYLLWSKSPRKWDEDISGLTNQQQQWLLDLIVHDCDRRYTHARDSVRSTMDEIEWCTHAIALLNNGMMPPSGTAYEFYNGIHEDFSTWQPANADADKESMIYFWQTHLNSLKSTLKYAKTDQASWERKVQDTYIWVDVKVETITKVQITPV